MATQFGHAFTAELTAQDVKAFSKALEVVKGVCQRRKVAKAAEAAAVASPAVVADTEADGVGQAAAAAGVETVVDGDRGEQREEGGNGEEKEYAKWYLEKEVELLSKARARRVGSSGGLFGVRSVFVRLVQVCFAWVAGYREVSRILNVWNGVVRYGMVSSKENRIERVLGCSRLVSSPLLRFSPNYHPHHAV